MAEPEPRSVPLTTSAHVVPDDVDQLVIISDLHGHRQPLDALEQCLEALSGSYHLACNGDLIYGGVCPGDVIRWVMQRVGGCAATGNHDEGGFPWGYDGEPQPIHTEVGALQSLSDTEREYLRGLPHRLELTWRGHRIVCMHGHRSVDGRDCSWLSSPADQVADFAERDADLVAVGHTHFPHIHDGGECTVANPGSVASPILAVAYSDTFHVQSGEESVVAGENLRSSFLLVGEDAGQLRPEIVRFDYDRDAVLEDMRAAGHEHLDVHRGWLCEGIVRF